MGVKKCGKAPGDFGPHVPWRSMWGGASCQIERTFGSISPVGCGLFEIVWMDVPHVSWRTVPCCRSLRLAESSCSRRTLKRIKFITHPMTTNSVGA